MSFLFFFLFGVALVAFMFNAASVAVLSLLKVPVSEFGIGGGRKWCEFTYRGCVVSCGVMPIGGYLAFEAELLESKSLLARLCAIAAGPLASMVMGFVLLGWSKGLYYLLGSFHWLIVGAWSPRTIGSGYVAKLDDLACHSFLSALGVFLIINSLINFFPVYAVAGGKMVIELARSWFPERFIKPVNTTTLLVFQWLTFSWIFAMAFYVL
jgi:Peptidase family M50